MIEEEEEERRELEERGRSKRICGKKGSGDSGTVTEKERGVGVQWWI